VELATSLRVFDQPDRDRIRQSLLDFENAAITEWSEAADGRHHPPADEALARLRSDYAKVQTQTSAQDAVLRASFANLDSLSQTRTQRVLQARTDNGPSWSLWAVIFITSGLLLGCAIIYGVEKPATHYTMVVILGVLVGAQLFLVLELPHAFIGEIGTSPEPLREVIRVLSATP
jgi:hypothetical protein